LKGDLISCLGPDLAPEMNRDLLHNTDPDVLATRMAFWQRLGFYNYMVTYQSALLEERALKTVRNAYYGLEIVGLGLGLTGAVVRSSAGFADDLVRTKVFWSKQHGKEQHWNTIAKNVAASSAKGEAKTIYTHKSLSTITNGQVKSRLMPDITEVMPSGNLRIYEVISPTQKHSYLLKKGWTYKQLLGNKLEYYDVINIGEIAH
jgi:hypothetical protein